MTAEILYTLQCVGRCPPNAPYAGKTLDPPNIWLFLGPHDRVHISIGSPVLAPVMVVTNRQSDAETQIDIDTDTRRPTHVDHGTKVTVDRNTPHLMLCIAIAA